MERTSLTCKFLRVFIDKGVIKNVKLFGRDCGDLIFSLTSSLEIVWKSINLIGIYPTLWHSLRRH